MLTNLKRRIGPVKGSLLSRGQAALYALAYGNILPKSWRQRLIARFWEQKAEAVHQEWGHERHDYEVLREILLKYRPRRLLDAGCGSGRLFALYQECAIPYVVGVDVSDTALAIARSAFPQVELHRVDLTELDFPEGTFDLCICNRVLQHVHPADISQVVHRLARASQLVYVNELTESDELDEAFFMRRHDYCALFAEAGMSCLERGAIGRQTYYVFGRSFA